MVADLLTTTIRHEIAFNDSSAASESEWTVRRYWTPALRRVTFGDGGGDGLPIYEHIVEEIVPGVGANDSQVIVQRVVNRFSRFCHEVGDVDADGADA